MTIDRNDFRTPKWLADEMCDMAARLRPEARTILEPTPGRGAEMIPAIKRAFPDAQVITPDGDFWGMPIQPVDLVIANPPFTPYIAVMDFISRFKEFSPDVITLMPWYLIINSEKRTRWLIARGLSELRTVPRRAWPRIRLQLCIAEFHKPLNYHPAFFSLAGQAKYNTSLT